MLNFLTQYYKTNSSRCSKTATFTVKLYAFETEINGVFKSRALDRNNELYIINIFRKTVVTALIAANRKILVKES